MGSVDWPSIYAQMAGFDETLRLSTRFHQPHETQELVDPHLEAQPGKCTKRIADPGFDGLLSPNRRALTFPYPTFFRRAEAKREHQLGEARR